MFPASFFVYPVVSHPVVPTLSGFVSVPHVCVRLSSAQLDKALRESLSVAVNVFLEVIAFFLKRLSFVCKRRI